MIKTKTLFDRTVTIDDESGIVTVLVDDKCTRWAGYV